MSYNIKAAKIILEDKILENNSVTTENSLIRAIGETAGNGEVLDLGSMTLVPGFIDMHIHGGNTYDTMDMSYNSLNELSLFKSKEGVTSFCPTIITTSLEKIINTIIEVKNAKSRGVDGAKILGSFLEGPYLNVQYKGAHPKEWIRNIKLHELEELVAAGDGSICSFAIAPELSGADEAIAYLTKQNINVRIGHSAATCEQANHAVDLGASIGIHTYNAMSPFTHRSPGMVGAILTNDTIYGEIICDFVHVDPKAIHVLLKCKGYDKVILVTDCMMAGGLSDGEYTLGELPVVVVNGECRLHSGVLAGSTLTIIKAISNLVHHMNIPLFNAVQMATINPAKALNADRHIGSIKVGKQADLVGLDENLNIRFVMVDGKIIHHR